MRAHDVWIVVIYVQYLCIMCDECTRFAFTCVEHERFAADVVLQAGRCFSGGVNGGGFDSQNWILTEVLLMKLQWRACIILRVHYCPGFAACRRCTRSHSIRCCCRFCRSVGVSHPRTRCLFSNLKFTSHAPAFVVTFLPLQTPNLHGRAYHVVWLPRKFKCVLVI